MIRFSIRRPVAVSMAYLAAALLGVAAWRNIPVELLPDTELPRLTVTANWSGASPETMEAFVTSPLEAAIEQVRGVEEVTSTSAQENGNGTAEIDVQFARDTDMNFARLDLLERFAALEEELPPEVAGPFVQPYIPDELNSQRVPFLRYTVSGPFTQEALRATVEEEVGPTVRQLEGVGEVTAMGGRTRVLQLRLDDDALAAHGMTPMQVREKVMQLEIVREAGAVNEDGLQRSLVIRQRAGSAEDVREAVLRSDRGRVVRVADVGTVHDVYEDARSHYRVDGQPAVQFVVTKEPGTNAIALADSVKARLATVEGTLPPGVRLILDSDESRAIRQQLTDLRSRAILSALVVFAVLLAFLGSFRSAVIVFATIGFSVLIALNLIYFAGYSMNVLTLMGLAMGFGLIADNAIVVLENIYRRWRAGDEVERAAEEGSRDVVLAILAATVTTLVVFIPFVYLQGELRLYYLPLAVVVGLSLVASLGVSFSFIPALGARLLRAGDGERAAIAAAPARQRPYERAYGALLRTTLRFPWTTVLVTALFVAASYWLFDKHVARGLVWGRWGGGDRSTVEVRIRQPRGEELARTDEVARYFEDQVLPLPYVARVTTRVFPQYALVTITFPDSVDHTDIPVALKEELTGLGFGFGGASVQVFGRGPSFYGGGSSPPNFAIQILGYNYTTVRTIADGLAERLTQFSRIRDVDVNAAGSWYNSDRATEIVLAVDRERLALHDITMRDVVQQVRAAVAGGRMRGSVRLDGEERQLEVKLSGADDLDVLALHELLIPTRRGTGVRLGDVAVAEERDVLGRILRRDQQYQRTVAYEFRGPQKLGVNVRDAVIAATALPDGYTLEGEQEWSWSDEEAQQLYGVLGVSLLLVFMVTAALFESLRQPVCVLLTVPMALIGVFVTFYLTRASFTREAVIGVIMMGGIVVNNSILLIDRVNQLRAGGEPLHGALVTGTMQRVRPILMTSVSTVLGLLPLVLFSEYADENIWNALGYALIGGLTSSTVLVLAVTPAIYLLLERGTERRRLAGSTANDVMPPGVVPALAVGPAPATD